MEREETDTVPEQEDSIPESGDDSVEIESPDRIHIEWAGYI